MEHTVPTKWGIVIGAVFLVVALIVWKMDGPADFSVAENEGLLSEQDSSVGRNQDMAGEGGPVIEEQRAVDIDAVIAEIETASVGDEAALDDELSDEIQSVQEGRSVIEDLGKSYDETSY